MKDEEHISPCRGPARSSRSTADPTPTKRPSASVGFCRAFCPREMFWKTSYDRKGCAVFPPRPSEKPSRVAPTFVLKYNIRANWAFWSTQSDLANEWCRQCRRRFSRQRPRKGQKRPFSDSCRPWYPGHFSVGWRLARRTFVSDRTVPVFDPDPCLCVCCQSSEISRLTAAPDFLFGPAKLKMRGS